MQRLLERMSSERQAYTLRDLCNHLLAARNFDLLEKLLTSAVFLRAKAEAGLILELAADYRRSVSTLPKSGSLYEVLCLLDTAIRQSQHIILENPASLAPQLCGRLISSDSHSVRELLEQLSESIDSPWLRPLSPTGPATPLFRTLVNTEVVDRLSITHDGDHAAFAAGNIVTVWNVSTGEKITSFTSQVGTVCAVSIANDGQQVLSASESVLEKWDVKSRTLTRCFHGHTGAINSITISFDARLAASSSTEDNTVRVWDLERGTPVAVIHATEVKALAFSANATRLTFTSAHGAFGVNSATVWDLQNNVPAHERVFTSDRHLDHYVSYEPIGLSANGKYVTLFHWKCAKSSGEGMGFSIQHVITGEEVLRRTTHFRGISHVTETTDGRLLGFTHPKDAFAVVNLDDRSVLWELQPPGVEVKTFAVTPDGSRVIASMSDTSVNIWDVHSQGNTLSVTNSGECGRAPRWQPSRKPHRSLKVWNQQMGLEWLVGLGEHNLFTTLAVAHDGQSAITASKEEGRVVLWSLGGSSVAGVRPLHDAYPSSLVVSPDGERVVIGCDDGTLTVVTLLNGRKEFTVHGHNKPVEALATTPDGQRIISGADGVMKVWNVDGQTESMTLQQANRFVGNMSLAVTHDGSRLISSDDLNVIVWDLATGTRLIELRHFIPMSGVLCFTESGHAVVASLLGGLEMWDVEDGSLMARSCEQGVMWCRAAMVDARRIVATDYFDRVNVWEFEEEKERIYRREGARITAFATVDSQWIIFGDVSGTVTMWNMATKEERVLRGHTKNVNCVCIMPDRVHCVSASQDHTVRIWNLSTLEQVAQFNGQAAFVALATWDTLIVAGDTTERIHFLRLENVDRARSAAVADN